MAVTSTIKATKFQIKYTNNDGTYTFDGLKNSGTTDNAILATARAFASVQKPTAEKYFKIIDYTLEDSES